MEARVAAGILLLVTLSLAAVVVTATRVATRSAVDRAADNLEGARSAFYRLVDERAEFAAQQTRLITELPVFRSMMINPVIAEDVATLTEMADSYRQSLNAQFAIVTTPDGRPLATPGWPQGQAMPPALRGGDQRRGRRRIAPRHRPDRRQAVSHHVGAREVRRGRSPRHRHVRLPARRSRCAGACADHARRHQPGLGQSSRRQQPERRRTERRRGASRGRQSRQREPASRPASGRSASASSSKAPSRSSAIARPTSAISCCCRTGRRRRRFSTSCAPRCSSPASAASCWRSPADCSSATARASR